MPIYCAASYAGYMMKKTRKILLIAVLAAAVAGPCAVAAVNLHVVSRAGRFIVGEGTASPRVTAAIVPGAAVWRGGKLSHVLEDRALTALALYRRGAVGKILATGDHGTRRYDEVNALKKFFLAGGVRPRDLFLDHAGFDTFSSMVRAAKVFSVRDAVVITQDFHLHRAVYLARTAGMNAWGVPADRRTYVKARYYRVREWFARVKSFVDIVSGRRPRFLGDPVPITGDGRRSWD